MLGTFFAPKLWHSKVERIYIYQNPIANPIPKPNPKPNPLWFLRL